jgi:hypothetical protein
MSFATIGFFIYVSEAYNWEWVSFIMVFRSVGVILISAVHPLYMTYKGSYFILLPPNQESIESLDMVLHIPIASEYFY